MKRKMRSGSEEKEDATNPEEPEPQDPDSGADAGTTEPGEADSRQSWKIQIQKTIRDMPETPGSEGNEDVSEPEGDEGTVGNSRETVKWMDRGREKGRIFPTIPGRVRKKPAVEMESFIKSAERRRVCRKRNG